MSEIRQAVESSYRGYEVVSFPPPSSGGVHVLEMLNILENFDLKAMDDVTRLHVMAEAMKLAFADRTHWLGDPDFANVPRGLIAKDYAAGLARKIIWNTPPPLPSHGCAGLADGFVQETHHPFLRGRPRRATGWPAPPPSIPVSVPRSSFPDGRRDER